MRFSFLWQYQHIGQMNVTAPVFTDKHISHLCQILISRPWFLSCRVSLHASDSSPFNISSEYAIRVLSELLLPISLSSYRFHMNTTTLPFFLFSYRWPTSGFAPDRPKVFSPIHYPPRTHLTQTESLEWMVDRIAHGLILRFRDRGSEVFPSRYHILVRYTNLSAFACAKSSWWVPDGTRAVTLFCIKEVVCTLWYTQEYNKTTKSHSWHCPSIPKSVVKLSPKNERNSCALSYLNS